MLNKSFIIKIILFLFLGIFIISQFRMGFFNSDEVIKISRGNSVKSKDFIEYFSLYINNTEKYIGKKLTKSEIKALDLVTNISEALIQKALFLEIAQKLGLDFSEDYFIKQIKLLPYFWNEDKVFDVALFEKKLNASGKTEKDFITATKNSLSLQTVSFLFSDAIIVPDNLVYNAELSKSEYRIVDIFCMNINDKIFPDFSYDEPDEKELASFFNSHKEEFILDERRTIKYTFIPYDKLSLNITDKMIKDYYDSNHEDFYGLELDDARKEIELIIRQNPHYIYEQDFVQNAQHKIAQLNSDIKDLDSVANYYGLKVNKIVNKTFKELNYNNDLRIKEFSDLIFSSEANRLFTVSAVNEGIFAFEVSSINPRKEKDFQEVKSDIKKKFAQNALNIFNINRFKEIHAGSLDYKSSIRYLSKDRNIKLSKVSNANVTYPEELVREIFSLYSSNSYTKIIKISSKLYFAHVKQISFSKDRTNTNDTKDLKENFQFILKNALIDDLYKHLLSETKVQINHKAISQIIDQQFPG